MNYDNKYWIMGRGKEALEQNRLLIISTSNAARQSRATALKRNKYVCEVAEQIVLVGAEASNSLCSLAEAFKEKTCEMDKNCEKIAKCRS